VTQFFLNKPFELDITALDPQVTQVYFTEAKRKM